jgi:hypothetical protein
MPVWLIRAADGSGEHAAQRPRGLQARLLAPACSFFAATAVTMPRVMVAGFHPC